MTAGDCDGGSSSIMVYASNIINKPSASMQGGRYLPNAFLVRRK